MSYGIKVIGANSQVILDESLPYFGVVAKGTAPAMWTSNGSEAVWVTIPSNVTNPILVVKSDKVMCILMDGNRFTSAVWNVRTSNTGVYGYYDWAILDSNRDNWIYSPASHGLRVRNGDGALLFDSGAKIFTVDSVFTITSYANMADITISVPTPRFGSRYVCGASVYSGIVHITFYEGTYVAVRYVRVRIADQNTLVCGSLAAYAYPGTIYAESVSQPITLFSGYMI